ncbi:MAG: hypothetical protein HJJLKODD_01118 [Phycisphaerae bacterium]|nr:hypothetical protein [Phycisphaerae bacterium]
MVALGALGQRWLMMIAVLLVVADQASAANPLPIEQRTLSVGDTYTLINFETEFSVPPIVVATPLTLNDTAPATLRIRNITTTGFEIRVQEYDYLDGVHAAETVSFLAVEPGRYTLPGGQLEAGVRPVTTALTNVTFSAAFPISPAVISSVVTENETTAVIIRNRSVTTTGFQVLIREQEAGAGPNGATHAAETMHFVAVTPGTTSINDFPCRVFISGNLVTQAFSALLYAPPFTELPALLVDMQTRNNADTCNLRAQNLTATGFEVQVDEETSADAETTHPAEAIGYLAVRRPTIHLHNGTMVNRLSSLTQAVDGSGQVTIRFRVRTVTAHPVDIDLSSVEYYDSVALSWLPIAAADLSGPTTGLASAADLTGPEHTLIWASKNVPALLNVTRTNLRIRFRAYEAGNTANVSLTARSPLGFTLDNTNPSIGGGANVNAIEDVAYADVAVGADDSGSVSYQALTIPAWLTLNSITGQLSGTPTNAHVGLNLVQVRAVDPAGNSATLVYNITVVNTPPQISSSPPVAVVVPGAAFSYDVQSSDENQGPTAYSLSGPVYLSIHSISGLISGTIPADVFPALVAVTVNDGHGGSAQQTFNLTVDAPPLSIDAGEAQTVAPGDPVLLEAMIIGGVAPYEIIWSSGDSGAATVVEPAFSAIYSVVVTDSSGQAASDQVTITVLEPLTVQLIGSTFGVAGSVVPLTAQIGGGQPPYEITWSTGQDTSTIDIPLLDDTRVTVTVIDSLGSGVVEQIELTAVEPLTVELTGDELIEPGQSAHLQAVISGGLEPFDIFWSTGASSDQIELTPQQTVIVGVVVTDDLGQAATGQLIVTVLPAIPDDNQNDNVDQNDNDNVSNNANDNINDNIGNDNSLPEDNSNLNDNTAAQPEPDNPAPCGLACGSAGGLPLLLMFSLLGCGMLRRLNRLES